MHLFSNNYKNINQKKNFVRKLNIIQMPIMLNILFHGYNLALSIHHKVHQIL